MTEVLKLEVAAFLTVLGVILTFRMLHGTINMEGLLKDDRTKKLSGGRLQLLIVTLVSATGYLFSMVQSPSNVLPDVPVALLLLVGGGNVVYLSLKIYSHLRST